MLQTYLKNQQIEHTKTKTYTNQNFQFHFHYRVISKNVLVKTQKPQLCHCPGGQMVKLHVSQAKPNCTLEFESRSGHCAIYFYKFVMQQFSKTVTCLCVRAQ